MSLAAFQPSPAQHCRGKATAHGNVPVCALCVCVWWWWWEEVGGGDDGLQESGPAFYFLNKSSAGLQPRGRPTGLYTQSLWPTPAPSRLRADFTRGVATSRGLLTRSLSRMHYCSSTRVYNIYKLDVTSVVIAYAVAKDSGCVCVTMIDFSPCAHICRRVRHSIQPCLSVSFE